MYAESIQRPFGVRYNPYTQSVEVLSSAKRITAVVSELRGDLSIVSAALKKVSALDHNLDVEKITQMLQQGLPVTATILIILCLSILYAWGGPLFSRIHFGCLKASSISHACGL